MGKCIDWLKVASHDPTWPDTVVEERQQAAQTEERDPPPLSRSLRVLWGIVLFSWLGVCLGLAFYRATRG